MPETSRVVHMGESRVAHFDMRQLGHQHKEPMRMITNSMLVAKRMSKRCSNRSPVKPSTGIEEGDRWTRGFRDTVTAEDLEQQQVITFVQGCEYYSNITNEKSSTMTNLKAHGRER